MTETVPETDDLIARMTGRAAFCRGRGEVKTPQLLTQAATALEAAQERIRELEDMLTEDATAPYLAGLSRGRREALEEAAASMEADTNLHTSLCCNGHECGCHGASVGEYAAFMIRALMEKDNG